MHFRARSFAMLETFFGKHKALSCVHNTDDLVKIN